MLDQLLAAVPPALCCQTFFLATAAAVLAVQILPRHLRAALTEYGARRPDDDSDESRNDKKQSVQSRDLIASLADLIRRYGQVPHSWFWHYYIVSLSWTVFWAWQYLFRGSAMETLARAQTQAEAGSDAPSTHMGRVFLAWSMLALQGARRLYECFRVVKPGRTPMLPAHWILGLAFYTVMNTAVWIHGSGPIIASWKSRDPPVLLTTRVPLTLALFFTAWFKQYECHRYLASLKKYTLPSEGLFSHLVCPHYTCECFIYLAIALMAAPAGSLFNASLLCGLTFVAVNLGVTAHGTKQWYVDKFGTERVAGKWKMIPFVF
ncbi:3-oxo-5-alpha-steroid 4-dehydrogenase domain-containing protein [Hirsutella rhossiliensis]|uniref:Polyprenal reductase n=1 Tax=Hirsutella rhossiliensis TaxID=111463 RepID=A0A9P8N8V4_9HYPO|nr:3-oxo-5-alpha-steroid 4-dehydrogenase domain-containing protein [Hirsutella rhossiliensis]KAH0966762.1 3-oxo-5-alpha-steroid 4-dehydrogenase domain-containing protein [Hirsutella rhossiliensis]